MWKVQPALFSISRKSNLLVSMLMTSFMRVTRVHMELVFHIGHIGIGVNADDGDSCSHGIGGRLNWRVFVHSLECAALSFSR